MEKKKKEKHNSWMPRFLSWSLSTARRHPLSSGWHRIEEMSTIYKGPSKTTAFHIHMQIGLNWILSLAHRFNGARDPLR